MNRLYNITLASNLTSNLFPKRELREQVLQIMDEYNERDAQQGVDGLQVFRQFSNGDASSKQERDLKDLAITQQKVGVTKPRFWIPYNTTQKTTWLK